MEQDNMGQSSPGKSRAGIIIAIVVIVLIIIAAYVLANNNQTSNKDANTEVQTKGDSMSTDAMKGDTAVTSGAMDSTKETSSLTPTVTLQVSGKNFSFSPNVLKVKKGDVVKVVFTSTSGFHDFVVDEFNAKTKQVSDGQSSETTFTADKIGTFEFYCSVGNHRQQGMVGQLIVE